MMRGYGEAIRDGFQYLLKQYPEVFCIGQGLWSPWYVGNTMTDLDKEFGHTRVIDTPVSETGCTGAAIGAALCGYKPIVIHPRVDFMILATDQIVNQAAKWSHMLGGQAHPGVTVRGIVNRGGQQGAQHSQALHSWYAHVPGLRVVMPATPQDARDLLIASVLCPDPVLYIDDRWLYDVKAELGPIRELQLSSLGPQKLREGTDITLVGTSFSTELCLQAAQQLEREGISCEVIDVRILNPLNPSLAIESVRKTGRLVAVDGGWRNCGLAGEILASVSEAVEPRQFKARPLRLTLPDAPAPTSGPLEDIYYLKSPELVARARQMVNESRGAHHAVQAPL
jgi:pyruvate dehydrogenase E1 component beta subunit